MDMGNRQAVPLIPVRQPRRHLPPRRSHRIPSYRLSPHESEAAGEDQEEESEGEGNNGGGIVCEEDEEGLLQPSVPKHRPQPNQQAPQGHFLDEEEEEITMRRTQPQATPHNNRDETPPHQQSSLPQEEVEMEEEGVGGDEGESETPRHTTGQEDGGHPFSHDKTPALLDPVWCLAGGCHHSFSGLRRGEHLRSHIHAVHRKQERMDITNEALISQGLVRCDACGEVCSASLRARAAHRPRCGHYTCRKEKHCDTAGGVPGVGYRIPLYQDGGVSGTDTPVEWPTTRPPTRGKTRGCRKECRRDVTSTSASGPTGWMYAAQSCWDTTPRRRMNAAANRWPLWTWCDTTYDCRRNRVVVATPPAPTTTSSITPTLPSTISTTRPSESCRAIGRPRTTRRARSAMRRATGPDGHQTERILTAADIYKARRAETLCTLQATGRAAALLTAAEAEPVVFSPELVQSLDDLYPQEDTRTYPEPAVSAPLVTFDSKDVAKMIESRLTRGAAPGLDGWTRELLYPSRRTRRSSWEITAILTDMANGNVAPEVAHPSGNQPHGAAEAKQEVPPDRRRVRVGKGYIPHGGGRGHASPQNLLLRTCNTGSATT
ncbi:putative SLACS retrotransposable element [Trypanosoma cruzi]|uniref:Putative SLACS retrotransposable element n=1 Tax=Trypanosoma cruzi TaxID=5693 RepID=A0A2V2UFK7_TRYCR|nr:putative SLACS retrotransposable element [Trypanosoma cruzi]